MHHLPDQLIPKAKHSAASKSFRQVFVLMFYDQIIFNKVFSTPMAEPACIFCMTCFGDLGSMMFNVQLPLQA